MKRSRSSDKSVIVLSYILISIFALICIFPLLLAFSISISNEREVAIKGFSLMPLKPTLYTYRYIIQNKGQMLLNSYLVTIFMVIVGTLFSLTVTTCYAYAASAKNFRFSKPLLFIAWFTMVFNGGLLPWYILVTKYYHLQNNLFALFVPYAMNVFYMFLMVNSFRAVPYEIIESAKIDGAGNLRTFLVILLPLVKVGLITIALFYGLGYWNDFYLSLMLVSNPKLYPLQLLLYNMMANIQLLISGSTETLKEAQQGIQIPLMTARMAMTCLTIGPIILVYPFLQKYFVKGIIIGALKG